MRETTGLLLLLLLLLPLRRYLEICDRSWIVSTSSTPFLPTAAAAAAANKRSSPPDHTGKPSIHPSINQSDHCMQAPRTLLCFASYPSSKSDELQLSPSASKQRLDLIPLRLSNKNNNWVCDPDEAVRLPGAHGEEIVRSIHVNSAVSV